MAEAARAPLPDYRAEGAKFLIVEARYYDAIGGMLLDGAVAALKKADAEYDIIQVPGALEIPGAISMMCVEGEYEGAVALGCVIRGETFHFEIVAGESSRALMDLTTLEQLAIGNGILTVENEEQAIARADPARGDKGGDAARAALALHAIRVKMQDRNDG